MSIDSHLNELVRRHQAIEEAIMAEESHPAFDDIKVHELKVKKLHLKDEIERLRHEAQMAAAH
ncbi:YdcH family protein [Roseiarcus sp.]|uniref:YdcH family protein n=1 Tax=Roseiarcus sp. TaxID=1969460 RepID=UPI003F9AF7DD